ncbi:DnaJ-domain-containing protein [Gloeophyllum trabeum ATCC 11539]|uniref:DnaJ-domain-containing protein n=1 Tax=Gloeophyllum trabeum (strain ATCC 11539 / FP-39264 / Madison 617) TaxID=670483 RepID=S7R6D5_GLOTA|nr:DnaJ-domain-containing protein [Gloeophyllum trabeum ATCC 11539]EPQ49935.1 DnaJ-domain-containing protein [Gloeophyllum trabeum ATCC 11539]
MPPPNPKDYHEVLQIRPDASLDEIRVAYKKMALKWHPDRHATDKESANEKFVEQGKPAGETAPSPEPKSEASKGQKGSPPMGTKATFTEQGNGPCEAAFSPKTKSQASEGSHPPSGVPGSPSARSDSTACPSLHGQHSPNPRSAPLRPINHPSSIGGESKEWIFPLHLTLSELFRGTCQRYSIGRHLLSGEIKTALLDVEIPPGCRDGARIRVPGAGNQRRDGSLQDIVFLVVQREDGMFVRERDDLVTYVQLPCRESSCYFEQDDVVYVEGMDGHMYLVPVPLSSSKAAEDYHIKGAGMPIRKGGRVVGYGDMVIRYAGGVFAAGKSQLTIAQVEPYLSTQNCASEAQDSEKASHLTYL